MNIKRAKEEIKNTVAAYLSKNETGEYTIPMIRQRPILLMGPPGIGKTQIMEQIARECGIALVAYTITHHTRQSAVGLPFVQQKSYGGKEYNVTEYTMSEIIASLYEKMEQTGLHEGILFLDEINCVSETLAPTMLQFLQCKTFGNQAVPAGWIIVAAGNPPEYNKSVRDFDIVTLDRVRRMDIEPDLQAFQQYARSAGLHGAIRSYLALHPQHFYCMNAEVDGPQFVTARGWEDLSNLLDTYEALGLAADEEVVHQYLQHRSIAEDFAAYLDLYHKYRDDYGVEEILAGTIREGVIARALHAPFDERLSLVNLLLNGLSARFETARSRNVVADDCYQLLRSYQAALQRTPDAAPSNCYSELVAEKEAQLTQLNSAGLLSSSDARDRKRVIQALKAWSTLLAGFRPGEGQAAFGAVRSAFEELVAQRDGSDATASAALENAFDFMERAFDRGQEMVVFVTELTMNTTANEFIVQNGCDRYFEYSKDLLLDSRKAALQAELERDAQL